jgi:hypothetical protein
MRTLTQVGLMILGLAGVLAPTPAGAQSQVGVEVWVGGGRAYPTPYSRDVRPHGGYDRSRASLAFDRGMEDGYREGFDDGRDRDRYDPVGEGRYRRGDPGYHPGYGPREYYRQDYRGGFLAGYERGYRDAWGPRGRYDRDLWYDGYRGRPTWPPYPAYPGSVSRR